MNQNNMRDYTWPAAHYGTLMNIDGDALGNFSREINWDYSDIEEKCRTYFNRYVDSGISDLIYCLDTAVPCKTRDWGGSKYIRKVERGLPVSYLKYWIYAGEYRIFNETDCNPYHIWLDLAWQNGMRPWLSFRMNDIHFASGPTHHSEFFYRARDNGWMVGDYKNGKTWYDYALDYSVPEVREQQLAFITEMLEEYDAFGIELDFTRSMRYFRDENPENLEYMTDFVRKVRMIVKHAEKKWGHPWRVMMRLCSRPERAFGYGFDLKTFAREGLADAVVPSSYWGSTDNAIPISEWQEIFRPYNIPVFYGLECHTVNWWHFVSPEADAGYCISAYAAGADGVYQFNQYGVPWAWKLGVEKEARKMPVRRFLTVMNDVPVQGYKEWEPHYLPVDVSEGKDAALSMTVGKLEDKDRVLVFLGLKSSEGKTPDEAAAALRVSIDGHDCIPLGRTGLSYIEKDFPEIYEREKNAKYPWRIFTYEVPGSVVAPLGKTVELRFSSDAAISVCYAELANGELNTAN